MFRKWFQTAWQWLDFRLGVRSSLLPLLTHTVPRGARWWYVFGSMTAGFLLLQIVTGICLALVYVPSAGSAYASLETLNYRVPLGWLLRALHNFGASGMVVMVVIHMAQVFLMGGHKYPRGLTWLIGVGLLACTLGMAFSGQVLRWDQDAYWTVGVATAMAGRVPLIGPSVVHLLLGGMTIGTHTLSRFFTLHVFVLVALLLGLLGLHLYLVVRLGISAPPAPGNPVDPRTPDEYERELETNGAPFYPDAFFRDLIAVSVALLAVVALSAVLGPSGPGLPPDPAMVHAEPRPDWYFLPAFALMALSPNWLETFLMLLLPPMIFLVLAVVPFLAGKGGSQSAAAARGRAVGRADCGFLSVLLWLGEKSPWSPAMAAWSGTPVPVNMVRRLTPEQLQGAATFQYKDCRNCHALEGTGGWRGPELTTVATRLTRDELIRQVSQGGGAMPAYRPRNSAAGDRGPGGFSGHASAGGPTAGDRSAETGECTVSTAFWTSWSLQPQVAVPLLLLAAVYTRGWLLLRRHGQRQFPAVYLACFLGSLATIWAAVASPLDPFGAFLLQIAHGAAPPADVGGRTAAVARPAGAAAPLGAAGPDSATMDRAAVAAAVGAGGVAVRNAPGRRLDGVRRQFLALARPATL